MPDNQVQSKNIRSILWLVAAFEIGLIGGILLGTLEPPRIEPAPLIEAQPVGIQLI